MSTVETKKFQIAHFGEIDGVPCPCGISKRAFAVSGNETATVHVVDISEDAKTHYHKTLTEFYLILEAQAGAYMELDGEQYPVTPFTTIMIKPYCRHRAVGKMKVVNLVVPPFDPEDEWFA
tara:strand:- start:308 stop:670 length:363 start_codon:yes stop_codon:yes gene_type:complete